MLTDEAIETLPNTSPITIRRFKTLGINSLWDLLNYFPSRYEDYSLISPINKVQPGETVTLKGTIVEAKYEITRRGLKIQRFRLQDKTGRIDLIWFNQLYLLSLFKKQTLISVAGNIEFFGNRLVMQPKEYELGKDGIHTGAIIPIYPEKKGLSSRTIREKVAFLLKKVILSDDAPVGAEESKDLEFLPRDIISYNQLIAEETAYKQIHFPKSKDEIRNAKKRLAFDEFFNIQLNYALVKKDWEKEKVGNKFQISSRHRLDKFQIQEFINSLPFKLTNAQQRVWQEIFSDLQKEKPMNRFLQGEVGSGKTVVAALACYLTYLNGYQSLFMAPTEILANQHYQTISNLFKNYPIKIGLQTGSRKVSDLGFRISDFDVIIGTHALVQKKISFEKVAFVIVDEQQRFGVAQRALLKEKGINPHLLTMTATPIPRTVALTIYGELDISFINELPKNRLQIKTYFVPKIKRSSCNFWIENQVKKNHSQVFIICPLIEESEVETMRSVKAATKEYAFLKEKIFPDLTLDLLHGRMKSKEKDEVMNRFKLGKTDILVTTPVVEVGIDIPNATIMLIEGAERFGLAQLHQLRGRVGRGVKQSYCFLFSEKEEPGIIKRLKFFAKTSDGNLLAEKDLEVRGPGELFGTRQHGYLDLKIANFSDFELLEKTKNAVNYFLKKYDISNFPELKKRVEEYKIEQIARD